VQIGRSIRLIKEEIPYVKIVLGISNIFGLLAAAREAVNFTFLQYCPKSGLDLAIANAEKQERFTSISENERRFAVVLLFNSAPLNIPVGHRNTVLLGVPITADSLQQILIKAPERWRGMS
jgi:cobalamin-dependent methionine synthase I